MNSQKQIYQEIADIETRLENANQTGDSAPLIDFLDKKQFYFAVHEHQRFFQLLITYKFHERPEVQQNFFELLGIFGQKQLYNRYMPNYFPNLMRHWINTHADYRQWVDMLYWLILNYRVFDGENKDNKIANFNVMGIHFVATISILNHTPEKKHFLEAIINHPIYRQAIYYYNEFVLHGGMDNVDHIHKICFDHIVKVRKLGDFDADPWIDFYNHYQYDDEYRAYMTPYYYYMDTHNIDYRDKLIFNFFIDKNIGDYFFFTQAMIHWSRQHNTPLIAMLTETQAEWIGVYFGDYFDAIIIRDTEKPPFMMRFLYPAANRAISLRHPFEDMPPYYYPRSRKRHFNYYTNDGLYDPNADIGEPIPISAIPNDITGKHLSFFKQKGLPPNNIILMSPLSFSDNRLSGSSWTLKEFWNKLVVRLKTEGFVPIINLSKPDEKHYISNVLSLHLPISHAVDFVNRIGGFIGVRSGLCDLLCASDNPKKYCVYPIDYIDWCNDLAPWYYLVHFKFDSIDKHIDDIITSLNGTSVPALENHQCYGISKVKDYSNLI